MLAEIDRIVEEQNVWRYKAYRIYKQRKQLEDEMIKKQQANDNEGNKN